MFCGVMRTKDSSRDTHGCCYITAVLHLSATLESKCLILERNIPLFGSSEPPLTQHETLTSTSKSCMTAHPNNEATQKNTNSAELDVCFSSVWACNYFALGFSVQSVLGGVGTPWCLWQLNCKSDVGQGYMLVQLVGFWLQELCVRAAKSWMEVIMCNLPICLHVIRKPWINNFIQVTIS